MVERRDALKALAALPGVACLERLEIKPDQVLVIKVNKRLRHEELVRLRATWAQLRSEIRGLPPAIVLDDQMDLAVMSKVDGSANA